MAGWGRLASGPTISSTQPSPNSSPSARVQPKLSLPSAMATGKAKSGTVESRIANTPAGSSTAAA